MQERLYAHGRTGGSRAVLLVLQGMDTSGKGGIVRHVLGMVDPQGVQLHSFGVPTEKERSQHYLQRIREALPAGGRIGVFDRSHYEDVLVVRVNELVPREVWEPRYDEINAFEQEVVDAGHRGGQGDAARLPGGAEGAAAGAAGAPRQVLEVQPEGRRRARQVARLPGGVPGGPGPDEHRARARGTSSPRTPSGTRGWPSARWCSTAVESLDLDWPPADFDVEAEKARLDAQPFSRQGPAGRGMISGLVAVLAQWFAGLRFTGAVRASGPGDTHPRRSSREG